MGRFDGKVAVITGAVTGIGLAVAERLASEGAKLVLLDVNADKLAELNKKFLSKNIASLALHVNVANAEMVDNAAKIALEKFGKIDIWINNAGVNGGPMTPIWIMPDHQWRHTMDVNLDGVFHGTRAAMKQMLKSGGTVINVASIMGVVSMANISHYVASKHAVVGLTKAAAIDGGPLNIRVNAVAPTFIRTALMEEVPKEIWDHLITLHPLGRVPTIEEVSNLISFLASDEACAITGSVYLIDGGLTAQ
ncbi:MAG: SDR family oxidoreductase [Caulobacterales bacterium]|nr:SDR family oxidoreductase [Caulobacterales bacterium]